MNIEQRIKNLSVPQNAVDVVLDTDTYNEIDDQFALAYLLLSKEKLTTKAIYAAPFLNSRSKSPEDGMEKSYNEILRILDFMNEKAEVLRGAKEYLPNEETAVVSPVAEDLAERAKNYSPQNPLYVVAIGAITNIASAIILAPEIAENIVVVWLGGHARHFMDNKEFNMRQDIAAARVVMKSGAPFVQLPCCGVVSSFTVSKPELLYWLKGKNKLCDYLLESTAAEAERCTKIKTWTRCIWDVTAVAWLLNDNERFMLSRLEKTALPTYDNMYSIDNLGLPMAYVYYIKRDKLLEDLFKKLTNGNL